MSIIEGLNKHITNELLNEIKSGKMHCRRCGRATTEGRIEERLRDGDRPNEKWVDVWIVCPECNRKELAWDYEVD